MNSKRHPADLQSPMCVLILVTAIFLWMFSTALAERDPGEEPEYFHITKVGGDWQQTANKPSNVMDGNPATRWSGAWLQDGLPPALIIDLGQRRFVNMVEITWHEGSSRSYQFSIQILHPIFGWVSVGGGSSENQEVSEHPFVASGHTGIIRIEGYGSDHPRAKTAQWTSIAEVRVGYDFALEENNSFCWY